ncbi:endonuclease III [Anaeromyxobacter paludicola]|uniref:Endonuclease III n=1 Tax=Anaeromyxobacter paludicola TaxID=2918171 RepID=A0ABM7XF19_9BACT|nr:endonuclease III [Anaeromyxobacter paludicola]BDG10446.1 endonuclease III [Anaeromyxobacter paludicola]
MRESRTEKRQRALEVAERLGQALPQARIALEFRSDLELLVAVVLSAQCTDARVNLATPALFARFPDAASYAAVRPEELWPYIQRLGLYRAKAKAIVAAMGALAREHGGRVPRTREALEQLPGVGRKTAGVVLVHLGAGAAFPVDTHVGRVSRRLDLTREEDPDKVERDLCALYPEARWGRTHQLFVWHGRLTCTARAPACPRCAVGDLCPKRGVKRGRPG